MTQEKPRRSLREVRVPTWHSDYHIGANCIKKVNQADVTPKFTCLMASMNNGSDSRFFREVVTKELWLEAMNEELAALEENGTLIYNCNS